MEDFNKDKTGRAELSPETKEAIVYAYNNKMYQKVCDIVDGLYGWKPGEIERKEYSQKYAHYCIRQVGLEGYVK